MAPVEAENTLVQIAREIPGFNSMMRTVEPGVQITEHSVDMRSDLMGSLGGMNHSYSMDVTH